MTKKTVFFIALVITGALAFSNTVSFQDDNYTGTVTYNETARPGDAVFARMNVKISKTLKKKKCARHGGIPNPYERKQENRLSAVLFF